MSQWLLVDVRVMNPGAGIVGDRLLVENGRITAVGQAGDDLADGQSPQRVDGQGGLVTPGLIDVHTHGIHRYLYEASAEDLQAGLEVLPSHGVTSVCPTCYQVMTRDTLAQLESLAGALDKSQTVHVPGFHLEGPFLKLGGAGASTLDGDVGLLEEILSAAGWRVAAMSISPDTKNILPVIERLREYGITPFVTHTQADYEQTTAAIAAGARHATHFYDVFPAPQAIDGGVRPVGSVEALLADPQVSVDFIGDGVHVHPGAIRLALQCKGYQGLTLITDANIGAGLAPGTHETPWGFPVEIKPGGGARIADPNHPKYGNLAGSALTMDAGMNNLLRWLDLPPHQVWAMGTQNPARLLNLPDKGSLVAGADADFVLWHQDAQTYRPAATWIGGQLVWSDP